MSINQIEKDIALLTEAVSVGPSRYDQLVPEIYEIYGRWRFDPSCTNPQEALNLLVNRQTDLYLSSEQMQYPTGGHDFNEIRELETD